MSLGAGAYFVRLNGRDHLIDRQLDARSSSCAALPGARVTVPERDHSATAPRWVGVLLGYTRPKGYAFVDLGTGTWLAMPEDVRIVGGDAKESDPT